MELSPEANNNSKQYRPPMFYLSTYILGSISPFYILWLLLMAAVAICINYVNFDAIIWHIRLSVTFYFMVVAVHVSRCLIRGGLINVLLPDLIFIFVYTLFHEAYLFLYSICIVQYSDFVFTFKDAIPQSLLIINLGLVGFIFGFELFGIWRKNHVDSKPLYLPMSGWGLFGIFLMLIGLTMHLAVIGIVGLETLRMFGYTGIQRFGEFVSPRLALFWDKSVPLMIFGIVVYAVYSSLRFRMLFYSKGALAITFIFIILMVLEGNRGPLLMIVVPLVFVRHYFIKSFKLKYLFIMVIGLLALFTAMKTTRSVALSPVQMYEKLKYAGETGQIRWVDPFVEMGSSYRIANMTAHLVPSKEDYWYGASWLTAIAHTVPFLQGYLSKSGLITWSPSTWMTTTMYGAGAAGTGFSVAAEGYLNFGFLGTFIELSFFGMLLRRICIWFSKRPSAFTALVMVGFIGATIGVIRNHINLVLPAYVQVFAIAGILNLMFSSESIPNLVKQSKEEAD